MRTDFNGTVGTHRLRLSILCDSAGIQAGSFSFPSWDLLRGVVHHFVRKSVLFCLWGVLVQVLIPSVFLTYILLIYEETSSFHFK